VKYDAHSNLRHSPSLARHAKHFLRCQNRPTEGYNGKPFDGTVVVPDICNVNGPKQSDKAWVHKCRQPLLNETSLDGKMVQTPYGGKQKLQTFDRVGWMLQQFLKMGCSDQVILNQRYLEQVLVLAAALALQRPVAVSHGAGTQLLV